MRRLLLWSTAALVLSAPAPVVAHGPCGCLDPVMVETGRVVRIVDHPAYRAVLNPRPSQFGIAPSYLASAYRAGAPTRTVLSRSRRNPTTKGRFRVPKATPAGLYMVLVWDGDEGGAHNTWDYLHVVDLDAPDPPPRPAAETAPPPAAPRGRPWELIAGVGLAGLLLGAAGVRATARRGRGVRPLGS